jgi:peptide/nickel transport system substrate-binding protein
MKRTALRIAIASAALVATVFAASASSKQTRAHSGTVTLEAAQGVSVLDPYKKLFQYSTALYPLLWNTLTAYTVNKGAVPQPQLAKSWKSSSGGKVYTFTLRPGLRFSDGSAINAAAVAASLQRAFDPKTAFFYASFFPKVTSVTAKGTATVVIKLATASNVLPTLLTLVPIEQVAAISQINTKPVVSGPFMVQEFTPNVSLTLVPNPKYWGTKPKVSAIKVVNAQDSTSAVAALQSGGADVLWGIPWNNVKTFKNSSSIKIVLGQQSQPTLLDTDNTSPPFNNVKARQALAYALDRATMAKTIYAGQVTAANTNQPVVPGTPYFNPKLPSYAYNLTKAKALFAAAGVKSGSTLTYWTIGGAYPDFTSIGVVLQASLKKIGINLTIKTPEVTTWAAKFAPSGKKYPGLIVPNFYGAYAQPLSLNWWLPGVCECNYNSTAFKNALNGAYAATSKAKQLRLLRSAQAILAKDSPSPIVMVSSLPMAVRSNIGGVWESPGVVLQMQDAYIK